LVQHAGLEKSRLNSLQVSVPEPEWTREVVDAFPFAGQQLAEESPDFCADLYVQSERRTTRGGRGDVSQD
jgi:hypothetical protein